MEKENLNRKIEITFITQGHRFIKIYTLKEIIDQLNDDLDGDNNNPRLFLKIEEVIKNLASNALVVEDELEILELKYCQKEYYKESKEWKRLKLEQKQYKEAINYLNNITKSYHKSELPTVFVDEYNYINLFEGVYNLAYKQDIEALIREKWAKQEDEEEYHHTIIKIKFYRYLKES